MPWCRSRNCSRTAAQWLRKVLANAPVALALTMEAVDVGLNAGLEEGLRFEAAAFGLTAATEDRTRRHARISGEAQAPFSGKMKHADRVIEGQLSAAGLRFAIVVSRFNSFITERLLGGALDALTRSGGDPEAD